MKRFRINLPLIILFTTFLVSISQSLITSGKSNPPGTVWIKFDCALGTETDPVLAADINECQIVVPASFHGEMCQDGSAVTCAAKYYYTDDVDNNSSYPVVRVDYDCYIFNENFYGGRELASCTFITDVKCPDGIR